MNAFSNLSRSAAEDKGDVVGGFKIFESDVYEATVAMAYIINSASSGSKATGVAIELKIDGSSLTERIYVTNRDGDNFYVDSNSGDKVLLPGFVTMDDLAMFATGEGLDQAATETRKVKMYDPEQRKEVLQDADVLVDFIGAEIQVAVSKQIVDKQKQGDDGKYHNTGETRQQNVIEKILHAQTGNTVTEINKEIDDPVFRDAWLGRNKGQTRDRSKGAGARSGRPGNGGNSGGGGFGGGQKKSSPFGR